MVEKEKVLEKLTKPWSINTNPVWLASKLDLKRNVEKFKFPHKLNLERRKQLLSLISSQISRSQRLNKPVVIKGDELTPLEKEFISEHFLSSENFQEAQQGEAIVLDETGEFMATLNLKDHIHLHCLNSDQEVEKCWNRLIQLEKELGEEISYSYNSTFGFLTSDPAECGTAFHISIYLQPSALIHTGQLKEVLSEFEDESVRVENFLNPEGNPVGDIIVITNNYSLGLTEESILAAVKSFAQKIYNKELELREKMATDENAELKDKVSRAYGILMHSYQIEPIEALNAIALLKFGVSMKWISNASDAKLNDLFFNNSRAHLTRSEGGNLPQEQIPHKRAEYIHSALKGINLLL